MSNTLRSWDGDWIEIKEGCELPPKKVDSHGNPGVVEVLVYSRRYPEQHLGRFREDDKTWTFSGSNSDFTEDITHWMLLPEPPEEIDDSCEGGDPCWRNPETGYVEYCPKHDRL